MPMLPLGSTGTCLNDGDAMSEYYISFDQNGQPYIVHGIFKKKGWEKKDHKYYQKIKDGLKVRYFYSKEEWDAYNQSLKSKIRETWDGGVSLEEAEKKRLLATQAYRDAGLHKKVQDERLKAAGATRDKDGNINNNFVSGLRYIVSPVTDAVGLTNYHKQTSELFDAVNKYDAAKKRASEADSDAREAEERAREAYEKSIKGTADRIIKKFSDILSKDVPDNKLDKTKDKIYFSREDLNKLYEKGNYKFKNLISRLDKLGIEYRPLEKVKDERSEDEIIDTLSGGDMTQGSCSSLAFAYIGNKCGYNVLDFRDGDSRNFFKSVKNIKKIASLDGVDAQIIENHRKSSLLDDAKEILTFVEEGKEYYFAAGQHASIIRKVDGQYQYLELQSEYDSGWKTLDESTLRGRFLCSNYEPQQFIGSPLSVASTVLIDTESLAQSQEFISMLGYINTDADKQRKGAAGGVR